MQGNKKLLVVVALLLLLTLTFTSYAIYRTSLAGNSTVNAAIWNVAFTSGGNTVTQNFNIEFDATDCPGNAHTQNGVIAPGASCTKTIVVNANDTQVDVLITAQAGTPTVGGSAISNDANDFTVSTDVDVTGDIITYDAATRTANVTVTLEWDDEEEATTTDPADSLLQGQTITVPITLTAKQVVPTTP